MRVPLNHAERSPAAKLLNRSQVYPGSHETGSEGMPERVQGDAVVATGLLVRSRSAERALGGVDGPDELAAHGSVGGSADGFLRIVRMPREGREVQQGTPSGAVERHSSGLPVLSDPH